MNLLGDLQDAVPAKTKASWLLQSAGLTASLLPGAGVIPSSFAELQSVGLMPASVGTYLPISLGLGAGLFYGAKALELFQPKKPRGIWIGQMFIPEIAFWTSFMITGRPDSGKTSGAIMPIGEQLFKLYLGPDYITVDRNGEKATEENPEARCGGIVLEVKGEFYELYAYLMDLCGRNVYEDFLVIRPDSKIPVAKFYDEEHKNFFYLNGMPCSTGSDAGRLLTTAQKSLDSTARIRSDIFSCERKEIDNALPKLVAVTYPVEDRDLCFLGWRRDGGKLVRVSHTPEFGKPAYLLDAKGRKQYVPFPKSLKFVDVILVSNNLVYNLIDDSVGAGEAAEKLTRMAVMSGRGEGKGGSNPYWYNNAQKLITNCIALHRAVHPTEQAHCGHVYSLVASEKDLKAQTALLKSLVDALTAKMNQMEDLDRKAEILTRQIQPLEVLKKYFADEWVSLDEKTKGIIKTVVSNTFSVFVQDPALHETYCSRPTFDFSETMQRGRVFAFVPGPKYASLAKVIGTGLKLDFQSAALSRLHRSDYNKQRALIQVVDECWNWVIEGGSGGGDPHFLSLCRAARVINLLATQNYSQFVKEIGREATFDYLGLFGVFLWLQNFNPETNKFAEELMETAKREKFKAEQTGDTAKMTQHWEEAKLYTREDFVKLGGDEGIVFNGKLQRNMATKTKLPKSDLTHPKEKPKIEKFMRRFLAGSVEQALWAQKRCDRLDPRPQAAEPVRQAPQNSPASAAALSSVSPARVAPGAAAVSETPTTGPKRLSQAQPSPAATTGAQTQLPLTSAAPAPGVQQSRPPSEWPIGKAPPAPTGSSGRIDFQVVVPTRAQTNAPSSAPVVDAAAGDRSAPRGPTPKDVDLESETFRESWERLSVAAAEVTADDEFGIRQWLHELAAKNRRGDSTAAHQISGPRGISVGDPALLPKAAPLKADTLDKLDASERAAADARLRLSAIDAAQRKAGPAPENGQAHFPAND